MSAAVGQVPFWNWSRSSCSASIVASFSTGGGDRLAVCVRLLGSVHACVHAKFVHFGLGVQVGDAVRQERLHALPALLIVGATLFVGKHDLGTWSRGSYELKACSTRLGGLRSRGVRHGAGAGTPAHLVPSWSGRVSELVRFHSTCGKSMADKKWPNSRAPTPISLLLSLFN